MSGHFTALSQWIFNTGVCTAFTPLQTTVSALFWAWSIIHIHVDNTVRVDLVCITMLLFDQQQGLYSMRVLQPYYPTRAVSSPMSDLGKEVLASVVLCPVWLSCPGVFRESTGKIFGRNSLKHLPTPNEPINIRSQIDVDCKSDHLKTVGAKWLKTKFKDYSPGLSYICILLSAIPNLMGHFHMPWFLTLTHFSVTIHWMTQNYS